MGLNVIPKYPQLSSREPATAREPIEDLFSQDNAAPGEEDAPVWWILGLAICVLPWILGIALISAL